MKDIVLETFAQTPLSIYTQISFLFPLRLECSRSEITDNLQQSLEFLTENFPWVAGKIVKDTKNGFYIIEQLGKLPPFIVKDYPTNGEDVTLAKLKDEKFPMRFLDESVLAPRSTIPGIFSDSKLEPVFILQATFLPDGLILTFLAHHQVMDGTGEAQMILLFSKACRGQNFTKEELEIGNLDREHLVPLLNETERREYGDLRVKLARQIVHADLERIDSASGEVSWAMLEFSAGNLEKLKLEAAENLTGVKYVSTDDALTAFLWKSISRARVTRLSKNCTSQLARAVNVRSHLGIPPNYPGVISNMTYNECKLEEIATMSLGEISSGLRSRLSGPKSTLGPDSRALATLISETQEHPITSATATLDSATGIAISSWSAQNSYTLDFGFGKPIAVRRPKFTPVESLIYILPKDEKGNLCVAICLGEKDWDLLRNDEEVREVCHYIA